MFLEPSLGAGADINVPDANGQMAMVEAALRGETSIIETLLMANADVDACNAKRCCISSGHFLVTFFLKIFRQFPTRLQ